MEPGLQFYVELGRTELDQGGVGGPEHVIDRVQWKEGLDAFRDFLLDDQLQDRVDEQQSNGKSRSFNKYPDHRGKQQECKHLDKITEQEDHFAEEGMCRDG